MQAEGPRNCPECGTHLIGQYCHQCGEKPPGPHDLQLKHFFQHGFHELTHLDSTIFRTLRALIFSPGTLTNLFDQINEHWQKDASFFQFGDVFFFALCLAVINRGRYFVEHLIFSLHTISFSLVYGSAVWLYYAYSGLKPSVILTSISFAVVLLYLWRAIPKVYGSTGGAAVLKAVLLVLGLELSRLFFITFTMVLALIQTLRAH